ncbi:deoxyribodipyrimidine photolyase, partial [Caulobacter sp. B11]|uniref:deoxyribodipyrimidine photo-lyase n=1 Tax=Caulobacter sp. B11 TaxID=2048899 RepID=UPI000C137FB0
MQVPIDKTTSAPIIVWLRLDLRLTDNPALKAATDSGRPVIPLYILDETPGGRPMGAASLWWLDKSLAALDASLDRIGSRLVLRQGVAEAILTDLVARTGAATVVWNRLYDAASIARDTAIKSRLRDDGVVCHSFNAGLLNEPWTVSNGSGQPYKVFTPYWRAAREQIGEVRLDPAPTTLPAPLVWPDSDALEAWDLHPTRPDWSGGFSDWTPGESGAAERLDAFLQGPVGPL